MVVVYSKNSCVQCTQTKKLLNRIGVEYKEINISEDTEAYDKVISMGFKSAPVVVYGEEAWAGFQPDKLKLISA